MKLILKELQRLIVNQLQDEITDSEINMHTKIWDGLTPETCMLEIDFDGSDISFGTHYKEGCHVFEFIDLSDISRFVGNVCIFELANFDFGSYEVM